MPAPRSAVDGPGELLLAPNRETAEAWPSTTTIGEAVEIRREHVSRATRLLKEREWLRKETRPGRSSICVVPPPLARVPPGWVLPRLGWGGARILRIEREFYPSSHR